MEKWNTDMVIEEIDEIKIFDQLSFNMKRSIESLNTERSLIKINNW